MTYLNKVSEREEDWGGGKLVFYPAVENLKSGLASKNYHLLLL